MDSLVKVQNLILCSIVDSDMLISQKLYCLNYLYWSLCWDFDIEATISKISVKY